MEKLLGSSAMATYSIISEVENWKISKYEGAEKKNERVNRFSQLHFNTELNKGLMVT